MIVQRSWSTPSNSMMSIILFSQPHHLFYFMLVALHFIFYFSASHISYDFPMKPINHQSYSCLVLKSSYLFATFSDLKG